MGLGVGVGDVGADRDAARVGMLDDRDGGLVEAEGRAHRSVRVDVVVVRHRLAVQHLGLRDARPPVGVERGRLVRVLAVPQVRPLVPGRAGPVREPRAVVRTGQDAAHPGGHGDVVRRGVREGLGGQPLPLGEGEATGRDGLEHLGVPVGRDDDRDVRVVLGGAAHHRRAADVDLLDALGRRSPRSGPCRGTGRGSTPAARTARCRARRAAARGRGSRCRPAARRAPAGAGS